MNDETQLSYEPWGVSELTPDEQQNLRNETVFSLGNGFIGTRGTFEEAYDFTGHEGLEGTYINGFYESEQIRYGEFNYGFPEKSQSMLNVTNAKIIRLFVDDEPFDLYVGNVSHYKRQLSFSDGVLSRSCIWETKSGKRLALSVERLTSFKRKHLLAISYKIRPLNFSGDVTIISQIETDVRNHTSETNPVIDYGPYGRTLLLDDHRLTDATMSALSRVKNNRFYLYTGCVHSFTTGNGEKTTAHVQTLNREGSRLTAAYVLPVKKDQPVVLTKNVVYVFHKTDADTCRKTGEQLLEAAKDLSFEALKHEQKQFLDSFWAKTDVQIEGDLAAQQGIRFNLYHILQATGRDGFSSVGAKGLSGEGYEGHYFWDTEMYVIPFYTHTYPELAKKLLMYRYHTLNQARHHARELGHPKGALYPWRTINGDEASAYFLLGSAQYHINGDIAYAIHQYATLSGDDSFMFSYGLEMLCEISRVYADVGHFSKWKDGKYVINCVTGPDEYNPLVDNNFYTNLIARETLKNTLSWLKRSKAADRERWQKCVEKLRLTSDEWAYWSKIVDNMYLGYDEKLGVFKQDDTFLQKKPWDTDTDKKKKRSLLYLHYHPLYVARHQMCKQSDTMQGMLLFSHLFTKEELAKNYAFYYPRTLHHSSLSHSIFGIIECRLGHYRHAYDTFLLSARMDLDDHYHNTYAGIHAANMAGSWMTLTYGLAGMNTSDGKLHFSPYLPDDWKSYTFKVTYRGSQIEISVTAGQTTYTLLDGGPVTFTHKNTTCALDAQHPTVQLN